LGGRSGVDIFKDTRQKRRVYSQYNEFCLSAQVVGFLFLKSLVQFPHGKNISNLATKEKEARTHPRLLKAHVNSLGP
jgi:hypothetical protein